jgi:uncharacterized membrane protein YgaE (UPF0421/DUF939 family)
LIARHVLHHPVPFFAPVAAIVGLGTSYGQRHRRVAEVAIGVALGVSLGDLFHAAFGSGAWQVGLVIFLAMSVAVFLDAAALLINQTAVQALVVTTILSPSGAASRVLDAFVGGAVALVAATVVPSAPLRSPNHRAAVVLTKLAELMRGAEGSSEARDADAAQVTLDRARETENLLSDLRAAAAEGLAVVRSSPLHRQDSTQLRRLADLVPPLDRAIRNTRVLIRRVTVAARLGETMPPDYLSMLAELADTVDVMSAELAAGRVPEAARPALESVAKQTALAAEPLTLSAAVVLAQIRSIIVDLLELTGLDIASATDAIPPRPA